MKESSPERTDASGNQIDDSYDDSHDVPQFGQRQKGSKKSKKSAGRSEDECLQKFQTIMYSCKKHPEKRSSFYDSMCEWHEADGRSSVHSGAGAPESTRTRGPADTPKGSSKKHRRQRGKDGKAEATKGLKRKKARSEASGPKHKGYDGDDAITKIRKHGAKEGWIVESYPPEGFEHERWFLKVQDGSTYVAENGECTMRNLRWLEQGSLTKLAKGYGPESLEIKMVKAYGESHYFSL